MLALAVGVVVGLLAAKATSGVMASLVYEIAPTDVATYTVGAMSLLVVAGLAAVIPTLRATRVNPARAMRAD